MLKAKRGAVLDETGRAEVPAWLKDREKVHLACLRGIIALNGDDALHVGGTSRNELDQLRALRAAEPPKPAHLREPPHCSTCECGMEQPTQPPPDLLAEGVALVRAAIASGDWKVDGACDPDSWLRRASSTKAAAHTAENDNG